MGIKIARDGVGVAKDCWEFAGNGCGWKKLCSYKIFGRIEKKCAKKNADENDNIVTITVPYMVVTRSFR